MSDKNQYIGEYNGLPHCPICTCNIKAAWLGLKAAASYSQQNGSLEREREQATLPMPTPRTVRRLPSPVGRKAKVKGKRRFVSDEEKRAIVALRNDGKTLGEISKVMNMPKSSITHYIYTKKNGPQQSTAQTPSPAS